jgi:hypothetical protein
MIIDKMPAGKYYVGDLCYVIDKEWSEVCELTLDKRGRSIEGTHTLKDGRKFAMFGTAYGDGYYRDQEGQGYSVDSGTIGCMKVEDITEEIDPTLGHVIDFPNDFYVKNNGGELIFGRVWIDTN